MKNVKKPLCKAFTLAELLTATLVISIIMVALAPVITRRAHDNVAITVNQKQGLEIFATPGIYSFDVPIGINTLFIQGSGGGGGGAGAKAGTTVNKTFTTSQTFTIPTGVNQVTFTITGAGGGGGGSNGSANPSVNAKNDKVYNDKCLDDEFLAMRGADGEYDLCYTKKDIYARPTPLGEHCGVLKGCCWNIGENLCREPISGTARTGCNRYVCQQSIASQLCNEYKADTREKLGTYRLPNTPELQKIAKYFIDWSVNAGSEGLELCSHNDNYHCAQGEYDKVPICGIFTGCMESNTNYCIASYIWGQGGKQFGRHGGCTLAIGGYGEDSTASVRCVRSLSRYNNFGGAGGASGAQLTRTINVLPKDTLTITIGTGGQGGSAGNNGSQGGTTQVLHKRNGSTIGTYYVKGGLGGNKATTTGHGQPYGNGTSSGQTTPSGTCYANANVGCNVLSYSGNVGSASHGGNGGRVNNSGTINDGSASSGGYQYIDGSRPANERSTQAERDKAKGQNATTAGFGGGGGLTPNWATSSSHFFGGGNGANGKVDISYSIALPGGGGGSGSRVGGDVTVNGETKLQEVRYKVTEGSRLVVKIGAGGSGGVSGQNGTDGEATVIGDNDIIFLGGEGGKIGSGTSSGNGGTSGTIKPKDVQTNRTYQYGLGFSSTAKNLISYTKTPTSTGFVGQTGKKGGVPSGYTITNTVWEYGFTGGSGGAPYGIRDSFISSSVACGGGQSDSNVNNNKLGTTLANTICVSGNIKGNDAKSHDPANNDLGGSGGGGGGVTGTSTTYGEGGNGAPGFLRIRWNEAEQE